MILNLLFRPTTIVILIHFGIFCYCSCYFCYLVLLGAQYCLRCCLRVEITRIDCCCKLAGKKIQLLCPAKVTQFFNKYFIRKIVNFLKNRSRPFIDTDYGPLDRELREDEDLLNSEKKPVSPRVYLPLGVYVVNTFITALLMSVDSFLIKEQRWNYVKYGCSCNNTEQIETYFEDAMKYSLGIYLNEAIMTFGGVALVYYLSLSGLAVIFQYFYRYSRVLRLFRLMAVPLFFGIVYFNYSFHDRIVREDITLPLMLSSLFFACSVPWEEIYTQQYMTSQRQGKAVTEGATGSDIVVDLSGNSSHGNVSMT